MSKTSYEDKIEAIKRIKNGEAGINGTARKLGIHPETLRSWIMKYESQGIESLKKSNKNKRYTKEQKTNAVEEYLAGKGSLLEICKKHKITATRLLRAWIMWYNGHKEFKERSSAKGEIYMTKGRKTTQEERAEIVAFCIEHNKDYGLTVERYNVSYQQVYAWVRKYEEGGVDKLKDNRGRTKPVEEMTEVEKLKAEMKILEAKNRQLEIENAFIKKLQELKGGGR